MKTYECFDLASITRLCPIIKLTGKFSVLIKGSAAQDAAVRSGN
jgi:hypothetical protein